MTTIETIATDFHHACVTGSGWGECQQRVRIHDLIRCTHTGEGLPVPPAGKRMESSCVPVLHFDGERIQHAAKVWNDHETHKQLGWVPASDSIAVPNPPGGR